MGAHAGNNNYDSIGICFEGSFDREQMNEVQMKAGAELVAYLKQKYNITAVQRHKDVNATGCPGGSFPFEAIAYGGSAAATPVQTARTANDTAVTLPLLAKKIGFDPAVMASPFITTIVDALSLLIYFRFASFLLGI